MRMGDVIPFPKPKIQLNREESIELVDIKKQLSEVKTLRELWYCKKRIKEFKKRVEKRLENEQSNGKI